MKIIAIFLLLVFVAACTDQATKDDSNSGSEKTGNSDDGTPVTTTGSGGSDGGTPVTTGGGVYKTINEMLTSGKNLKCTYSKTDSDGNLFSEVVYVSGENIRIDVSMEDQPKTFIAHTIKDNTWLYGWNNIMPTGTKTKLSELENVDYEPPKGTTTTTEKPPEFVCASWSVDSSMFRPPSDVTFRDVTDSLKDTMKDTAQEDNLDMCALCMNAPTEEAKNNCLEASNC